ncbi:MAG TPA: hypothetical protein VGG72_12850 [Bryobacteraceae bacterium]
MADFRRMIYAFALVALLAGFTAPAFAQNAPFACATNVEVPPEVRAEGWTELVGDITMSCTGGVPTPAGQVVQPVNIVVNISTNLTSRLLSGGLWTEALLIIDEPHSATNPGRPILNCGNTGAPDSGPSGANVCAIVATSDPSHTYDGQVNGYGGTCSPALTVTGVTCASQGSTFVTGTCVTAVPPAVQVGPTANAYSCGRPNVFQGRLGTAENPNQYSAVSWLGVPMDPPGTTTTRTLRITNIRADAHDTGVAAPGNFFLSTIQAQIAVNGNTSLSINNQQQIVAYVAVGLITSINKTNFNFLQCVNENVSFGAAITSGTFNASTVSPNFTGGSQATGSSPEFTFSEGFASSWKTKNIAMVLSPGTTGGNGTTVAAASYWSYDGTTVNYPKDVNQNVPGAIYNTESGFMYPGSGSTLDGGSVADPEAPNNPPFGLGTVAVTSTALALHNSTLIDNAGIANQGTRLQVQISNIPAGAGVLVPEAIWLTNGTANFSGIAMLVNTDSAGAGAYSPVYTGSVASAAATTFTTLPSSGMAVYEVIDADPFSVENAVVTAVVTYAANLNLNQPTPGTTAQVFGGFAPFYNSAGAHEPEPLTNSSTPTAIPRFVPGTVPASPNFFSVNKCSCNLLFPFVSSAAGYDTGIAIANTSQDNLGTNGNSSATQQFGGVTFWYYGQGNNGGTAPPAQCTNLASPGTCPTPAPSSSTTLVGQVPAGQILTYVLSSGGGSIASGGNGLDNRANGFSGYMIAQAQFQYCHAYAFITAVGAGPLSQAVSEGYLGLVLDNTSWNCPGASGTTAGACRTNIHGENLVH